MLDLALSLSLALALQQPVLDSLERERVQGELGARIDAQLTRFAEYGFAGTVLVVQDGRILLLKGYGLADVARGVPNGPATRYEMNSLVKMFTAAAVLQLEADGRLRRADPVERHLGDFPAGKSGATVEQLASHTSGLVVAGTPLAGESRESFVEAVKRTPRESAPGTRYRYTNAGYSLLAAIVERVSGTSYHEYLRRNIFRRAGMRTAVFRDEVPDDDPRFARGYVGTPAGLQPGPPNPYVWGTRGAGGVWTTVGDILRWVDAAERGSVIGDPQRSLLFQPPRAPSLEAYGWHVDSTPAGRPWIHKGGGSDDFASQLLHYPRDRVTIVWATNNLRQRWRRTLNRNLPAIVFGGTVTSPPAVACLSASELTSRAGLYMNGADTVEVHRGAGFLYVTGKVDSLPTTLMFHPQRSDEYTGFDPATGVTTRLRFHEDGSVDVGRWRGKRIGASSR